MLVDDSTVKRYKSDLTDEVEPVVSELIEKSEQGLKALQKKEHQLKLKVKCIDLRVRTELTI